VVINLCLSRSLKVTGVVLKKWSFIKREESCTQRQERERKRKRERVGPALSGKYCEAINLDLSKVGSY
jgi:hypothetical protein